MRRLFIAIFIPVLLVLGTPALIATLMYDGTGETDMPTHLYVEGASAKDMLYKELTRSVEDLESGVTDDMIYNLNQDIINTAIFEAITQPDINPDYMPNEDCVEDSCKYIFAEPTEVEGYDISFRLAGLWVDFENDKFVLNIFLEVQLNDGFTYKTVLETHFELKDEATEYVLEFDKIRIGNFPIPSSLITSVLSTIDSQIDQVNLDNVSDDLPFGEFDAENLRYTLPKDDILELIAQDDEEEVAATSELAKEVLSIVFDKGLLTFKLHEEELVVTAGVSKFKSDDDVSAPLYLNSMHFKEEIDGVTVYGEFDPNSFDPEKYLKDKFTEFVFNYAFVPDEDFIISEQTINKLIYFEASGFDSTRTSYEYTNQETGELEVIDIGLKSIWFELTPGEIYIDALFKIAGIDSLLKISAVDISEESDNTQLKFEFTEITFGKDELETDMDYLSIVDLDVFKQVFADLGDVEFGEFDENGTLVITAEKLSSLMNETSADQAEGTVSVDGIAVVQDGIQLEISVNSVYADLIDDFTTELNNIIESDELIDDLEAILDTTEEGPEQEVFDAVVELQNLLGDGDPGTNPDADLLIDMFENFEELDSQTQDDFLTAFEDLIDEDLLSEYQDLFSE